MTRFPENHRFPWLPRWARFLLIEVVDMRTDIALCAAPEWQTLLDRSQIMELLEQK